MRYAFLTGAVLVVAACSNASEDTSAAATEAQVAAEAQPAAAASPSFDCARTESSAMELVCKDANLAAMDRELARVYELALADPNLTADRRRELQAMQRGWIKGRDDCWKADDLRTCVMADYAMRIAELRTGYANARSQDAAGASTGPVALACEGIDFGVSATFIQTNPGAVALVWKDQSVAFDHVPSGSGARYEGSNYAGKGALYTQGDEAMLTLPGESERKCKVEEIG